MVVDNNTPLRDSEKISSGDDIFGTTSHSSGGNSDSSRSKGEYVIKVDTAELVDTAVKSVAGGLATGLVVNKVLDE